MKGVRTGVGIALVGILAGGGGAYAATQITSAEIKDGTIQAKDIKKGTITASNLAAAARTGMTGPAGATGAAGPAGRDGRDRACGAAGATGPAGSDRRDGCRLGPPGRRATRARRATQGRRGPRAIPVNAGPPASWARPAPRSARARSPRRR